MPTSVERSLAVFPAGGNGEFNLPAEFATVIARGKGCELWTVDGRRMLDFSMGWGSVLAGHARSEIANAVSAQARNGFNYSYVSEQSLTLAEEIVRLSPACQSVRFCASGTEATMYCLRLARAARDRSKILKFEGAYHGAHDIGVASLFPAVPPEYPRSQPSSSGVDSAGNAHVLVVPFNDLAAARDVITDHHNELAAVIIEPLQRCLSPVLGFLEGLREITRQYGVLLIFDEVVTGFRLAYGGAQELFGVVPDLVAYGKALGGGLPIGVFGGPSEIMDLVREDRLNRDTYVWTASTLGGNPISAAAANAALRIYRHGTTYPQLRQLGDYFRAVLAATLSDRGVEATVIGTGPIAQIIFTDQKVRDYRTCQHREPVFARRLMLEMFARGIFLNPMGTKLYLSLAHDQAACDEFCAVLGSALDVIRE